ncbi:MAG: potassium channel family protein [Syntrophobacteraceae bacterium]
MPGKLGKFAHHFWSHERGPYALLFLLVFTLFVLAPLLSARIIAPLILKIAFSLIIISGALTVTTRKSLRLLALVVGLLSVAIPFLGAFSGKTTETVESLLEVGMLVAFALLMAKNFLVQERAPGHRIAGAVTIYLLLGLIWTRLYQLLELVSPGSFRFPAGEDLNAAALTYFSFVTLATLGYGDITPISLVARDLAVLEAVMGQLYLVILISWLVSHGVAKSGKEGG